MRCLRARLGISQEELGFRSGMHRNFVGSIERGEGNPTLRVIAKLARGLALPITDVNAEFVRCLNDTYAKARSYHALRAVSA